MSNKQDQPRFSLPIRVYYDDTDFSGATYYANYLKFMEHSRTEWMRSLGIELDVLRRQEGLLFVVRRAEIDYLRPTLYDDRLTVTAELRAAGGASLDFLQEIHREAEAACCCRGRIKIACVDARTMRPRRLPARLLAEVAHVR
ncbi:MAG: tol-pal system-associated acyl-CoA thioesterase [Candidatus Thiosymbion ectosymbiont of Robbea hypermnestra]|nr:tol-pal system-associated acyl-CoA thioesterase [Candidatus Thiosymbion ectosymbiont of Robbea hypermnestra]